MKVLEGAYGLELSLAFLLPLILDMLSGSLACLCTYYTAKDVLEFLLLLFLLPLCWDDRHVALCSLLFVLGMNSGLLHFWASILPTQLPLSPLEHMVIFDALRK